MSYVVWGEGFGVCNQVSGMSLPGVVVYTSISFTACDSLKVGGSARGICGLLRVVANSKEEEEEEGSHGVFNRLCRSGQ
jgi:hypothetical protein